MKTVTVTASAMNLKGRILNPEVDSDYFFYDKLVTSISSHQLQEVAKL